MSANIEFNITAFDEASSVFQDVSSSATECFTTVTTGADEAAESVSTSSTQISSATESVSGGFTKNAMAMNTAALSAAGLAMGVTNIENAEVSLDRAHVTLEKDTNAVQSAQEKYNEAVAKYGANSQQAQDAADKLKAAQDALSVAQERVDEAQRNMNETIMMSSLTIIPSVIGAFASLSTVLTSFGLVGSASTVISDGLSMALWTLAANPIVLVIAGIAALAIGLYEAYEHCAPFRDAINAIGSVLGGAFKAVLTDISDTLNFLWNDVFKPFGEFLATVFIDTYLVPLEAAWNALSSGLNYLWNNVLVPVANFFKGAFTEAINFVMAPINAFESAISKVSSLLSPITNGIGTLTNALKSMCFAHAAPAAEEFNKQLTSGIELSNNLTQKLDPLKQGLLGVSGSTGSANVNGLNSGTQHITVNPTINIGKIDRTTGLQDVINSVNQGTAQALQRRF
jgi:hypothetical protein